MAIERKKVVDAIEAIETRSGNPLAPDARVIFAFWEIACQRGLPMVSSDVGPAPDFSDPRVAELYEDVKAHKDSL